MNINDLIKACNINGVTELIINKLDVLVQVNKLSYYLNNDLHTVSDVEDFKNAIETEIFEKCPSVREVIFSVTPFDI